MSSPLLASNAMPKNLVLADLDADGDLDIAYRNQSEGVIAWHANDGHGQFGSVRYITQVNDDSLGDFAVGDVDGDGDIDVVAVSYNRGLVYFENTGTAFAPGASQPGGDRGETLTLADFDGDGDLDVFVAGRDRYPFPTGLNARWLVYDQGAFVEHGLPDPAHALWTPTATDIDGDGDADVVVTTFGGLRWYRNDAGSLTEAGLLVDVTMQPPSVAAVGHNFDETWAVHAADITGDGAPDLVYAWHGLGEALQWVTNPLQQAPSPVSLHPDQHYPNAIASFDADCDGDLDIVAASMSSWQLAWFENVGGQLGAVNPMTYGGYSFYLAVGDVNGDGRPDVVSFVDDTLNWYENPYLCASEPGDTGEADADADTDKDTDTDTDTDTDNLTDSWIEADDEVVLPDPVLSGAGCATVPGRGLAWLAIVPLAWIGVRRRALRHG